MHWHVVSSFDLKEVQVNVHLRLNRELGHNSVEATKIIYCVIMWKEQLIFHSGCKNLNNQIRYGKPKRVDSESVVKVIEAYSSVK